MAQTQLNFESKVFKLSDGTERVYPMRDDRRIELMLQELMAIYQREEKRPDGYNDLPYNSSELLLEAIGLLERAIEWDEPTDDELLGEPPMTADEMHSAAWKEHQEAHR
jgi:hypothetical protein